jgi:hypothetical protein
MSRRRLSIALVHHPVLDAKGAVVTSTLTTMDVHDCARSGRTFGCESFFIVHPIEAQKVLAHRIVEHWTHGSSAKRIPDRKDALAIVRVVSTLDEAIAGLRAERAELWVTAARSIAHARPLGWARARAELDQEGAPVLLVFGTSWGLAPELVERADAVLEPIRGPGEWNHLSVRAACAIALDRLAAPPLGE